MRRTAQELRSDAHYGPSGPRVERIYNPGSYHTEDADVEHFDTRNTDPLEWPSSDLADALVRSYFEHVHNAFPLLDKSSFTSQYLNFVKGSGSPSEEGRIWLGILNSVFAIGAVFAHLTKASHRGHYYDHRIYHSRAKMLTMGDSSFSGIEHDTRVSRITALALSALYYLAANRLNR